MYVVAALLLLYSTFVAIVVACVTFMLLIVFFSYISRSIFSAFCSGVFWHFLVLFICTRSLTIRYRLSPCVSRILPAFTYRHVHRYVCVLGGHPHAHSRSHVIPYENCDSHLTDIMAEKFLCAQS